MIRSVWSPPYWAGDLFFTQPSWSNMIFFFFFFLQHLMLTWQSFIGLCGKCESCSCENTWEVMCVSCYDSPSWNLCKIFFVDFTLKVKMLKPQNVSNFCEKINSLSSEPTYWRHRRGPRFDLWIGKRLEYALSLIQPFKERKRKRLSMWGFCFFFEYWCSEMWKLTRSFKKKKHRLTSRDLGLKSNRPSHVLNWLSLFFLYVKSSFCWDEQKEL